MVNQTTDFRPENSKVEHIERIARMNLGHHIHGTPGFLDLGDSIASKIRNEVRRYDWKWSN